MGLFRLSRYLTKNSLRILCYHGFEIEDESRFRPLTFIKQATFEKRIAFIKNNHFNIISLDRAVRLLKKGELPDYPVVITIDDGFYSTYKEAFPILNESSIPAVVYVTTYYAVKQTPVFRLVVQYMFWKTKKDKLNLLELTGREAKKVGISDPESSESIIWEMIKYGEIMCEQSGRENILRKLGERLDVDYDKIRESRMFSIMSIEELKDIKEGGIDLELHTHRHNFPVKKEIAKKEIQDNRQILKGKLHAGANHFCYPSGYWKECQLPWLRELNVHSGVTCDPGLNYPSDNELVLKRFLDGQNISEIEFKAEMFGFLELMRKFKKILNGS